jgi:hypothetical protein
VSCLGRLFWVAEHGRPRPTRPCPKCGRVIPVSHYVRAYLWAVWGTGIWYLTSSGVIAVLG